MLNIISAISCNLHDPISIFPLLLSCARVKDMMMMIMIKMMIMMTTDGNNNDDDV